MLSHPVKGLKASPAGLFPTYCFEPGKDILRVAFDFGTQLALRNSITTFKEKNLSADVLVQSYGVTEASGHIVSLVSPPKTAADFSTDGLSEVDSKPVKVAADAMAEKLVNKPNPRLPVDAKGRRIAGSAVLDATIGTDGRIQKLAVESSTDPDLAIASIAAVRHWTYSPYKLKGVPTDVETTITMVYAAQ
jgi:TonB family protein